MRDFAALHRTGDALILPNVWDVASARCLVEAGFPALGTPSPGVAAAGGLPDGLGATNAETLRLTHSLAKLSSRSTSPSTSRPVRSAPRSPWPRPARSASTWKTPCTQLRRTPR
jgi:hypothetical protein